MKNKLSDLNDHLFAEIERLSDEGLKGDELEQEVRRAEAIVKVSDQIVGNAALKIQAAKIMSDHGLDPTPFLALEVNKTIAIEGKRKQ